MDAFSLRSMIISGWPVLTVLLIMSIVSCTVILDRILAFNRARMGHHAAFVSNVMDILDRQGAARVIEFCRRDAKPISRVISAIVSVRTNDRAVLERAAQYALQAEINSLESYVPILGTIASTAPFVGLLGTVIGIIKAFQDIAMSTGGGPQVVAVGIAEALITTAVGLCVAIPATMFYNFFVRHTQTVSQDIDLATYGVVEKLAGPVQPQEQK